MKVLSVRIRNFRSIIDSGWIPLSPDGITVFVGQNESGKTSVLEALHYALSRDDPTEDDFRIGAGLPIVNIRAEIDYKELQEGITEFTKAKIEAVQRYLLSSKNLIELLVTWEHELKNSTTPIARQISIVSEEFRTVVSALVADLPEPGPDNEVASLIENQPPIPTGDKGDESDEDHFSTLAEVIWSVLPLTVLFNEESGRLPNQVEIDDKNEPTGPGRKRRSTSCKLLRSTFRLSLKEPDGLGRIS